MAKPSPLYTKKRGRPSLGPRVGTHTALPAEFRAEIEVIAAEEELPMGAIITRLVAQGLGKEPPSWCLPKAKNQEELPLDVAS
jgi:hypothetical protein